MLSRFHENSTIQLGGEVCLSFSIGVATVKRATKRLSGRPRLFLQGRARINGEAANGGAFSVLIESAAFVVMEAAPVSDQSQREDRKDALRSG